MLLLLLEVFPTIRLDDHVLREMGERSFSLPAADPKLAAAVPGKHRTISGSDGAPDVAIDVYHPRSAQSATPAKLHIHGGGSVAGSASAMEPVLQTIAYRHVYPGALHGFDMAPFDGVAACARRDSAEALARALARTPTYMCQWIESNIWRPQLTAATIVSGSVVQTKDL